MRNILKKENLKIKNLFRRLVFASFMVVNIESCGFAYREHVTGRYYIIGGDTSEERSLCYSLSGGDYIGKAPGRLQAFGFNDTFLVARTIENNQVGARYYVINMTKDGEMAHEKLFRAGPFTEDEYKKNWSNRLNITFNKVE
jgi:hypothetical protein